MLPSGRIGTASATASPSRSRKRLAAAAATASTKAQPVREEGQRRRGPAGEARSEHGGQGPPRSTRVGNVNRCPRGFTAPPSSAAQLVGELARRRPARGTRRERAVDELEQPLRQVRPELAERPRAGLDRARRLEHRAVPERMPSGERLPEHHADRPDVRGRRRLVAREPLRRDVRERPGDVSLRGQRLGLGHAREPEVEEPHRDAVAVGEQDVRRLHVAVEDPGGVRVREAVADLRARLDRRVVRQLARAERLAERAARHELVRDVDVRESRAKA